MLIYGQELWGTINITLCHNFGFISMITSETFQIGIFSGEITANSSFASLPKGINS